MGKLQSSTELCESYRKILCNESVTYATHGELGFLHNLVELASRWQGPISVAVYAPGESFQKTLDVIFHLRECSHNEVKKLVTFHIFFHSYRIPNRIPKPNELLNPKINCSIKLHDIDYWNSSHHLNEFLYPVNVARNVAKSNSATYFYFTSDIELYPSLNIIPGHTETPLKRSDNFYPVFKDTLKPLMIMTKKYYIRYENIIKIS
ncbi:Beta-1,4-glucuronyltransferase 1 [Armadillidium vulgare]|nr:Beta-1,4-glucuronyltransferase 1 [Armadillidium vulgare]